VNTDRAELDRVTQDCAQIINELHNLGR
jgi:hypothetical protein